MGRPNSLAELFSLAAKHLKQVKNDMGNARHKKADSRGALGYYRSFGRSVLPAWQFFPGEFRERVWRFDDYLMQRYGTNMNVLNDLHDWSFERFASEALKAGL